MRRILDPVVLVRFVHRQAIRRGQPTDAVGVDAIRDADLVAVGRRQCRRSLDIDDLRRFVRAGTEAAS